jgi:hypothetical protein
MQFSLIGVKMTVTIGSGSSALTFELYESNALDKKTELQSVLFRLAEKSTDLENKLEKATNDLNILKKSKGDGPSGIGDLVDFSKGGKNTGKMPTKQPGMSVVNPNSKKRKVAKGVDFS